MRWRKVEGSGHVEDRRGRRGAAVGGAVGGLGILGILAALFFGGGSGGLDLNDLFNQVGGGAQAAPSGQSLDAGPDPQAELVEFMKFVMTDNQNVWDQIFRDAGESYEFTRLSSSMTSRHPPAGEPRLKWGLTTVPWIKRSISIWTSSPLCRIAWGLEGTSLRHM